ncbi:MAG: fasciclin domain-containing protein [Planctomycetota bacterium]
MAAPGADLTVFAPSDAAFASVPPDTLAELLLPENKDRLASILKFHVLPKRLLLQMNDEQTLGKESVELRAAGRLMVEDAKIVLADIKTTNGVIHVIDRVLLPALPAPTAVDKAIRVINKAINRGVPQFNAGNPEACAAIYEIAAESLLTGHTEALDDYSRERLRKALADIHSDHNSRAKAWTLRYALDDVSRWLTARKHAAE